MRAWQSAICAIVFLSAASAQAHPIDPPITPPPGVQLAQGVSATTLLPGLVEHSRHLATLQNGQLSGEGADFLRALGRNSHFVMLGEDHGNSGIAQFAEAYWRDLNALGYNYAAVEVDPYVAEAGIREMRAGGVEAWDRFLQTHGGTFGAAFWSWGPEADYINTIVHTSHARREPPVWGLDQVFIGSAPWMVRDIAEQAHSRAARALAAQLAQEAAAANDTAWFGKMDGAKLEALRAQLNGRSDTHWAEIVDAMIVSHRIYAPFVAGAGESYLANTERETLMKRTFLAHYEAAMRADGSPPRVMLKFGSNHMMRGATPTWVQGTGGFITEYAMAHGLNATTILMICGPGGSDAQLQGPPVECHDTLEHQLPFLAPFVDAHQLTIFDLREWRLRPRRWADLPAEVQMTLGSYDVIVVVPGGAASQFLPNLPAPPPPPPAAH